MRIVRIVKRRVHSFLRRSNADAELQFEIEIHIQQLTSEAMASGMAEAEARAVVLREFGPVDRIKEQCRDTRRVSWIQDFARDLLYGLVCCGTRPASPPSLYSLSPWASAPIPPSSASWMRAFAVASLSRSQSARPDVRCSAESAGRAIGHFLQGLNRLPSAGPCLYRDGG